MVAQGLFHHSGPTIARAYCLVQGWPAANELQSRLWTPQCRMVRSVILERRNNGCED
jgi:hypothetical protein